MIKPDLTYLETIAGGDKSFIDSILNLFIANTFPELEKMKIQASQQNWDELGNTAHKIKAPIQMMGIQRLSELIYEIEMMGKQHKDLDLASSKIAEIELMLNELRLGIEAFLKG